MFRASFSLLGGRGVSRCAWCREKVRTREPANLRFLTRLLVMLVAFPVPIFIAHVLIFRIPDPTGPGNTPFVTLGERMTIIDPSLPLAVIVPLSLIVLFAVDAVALWSLFRTTRLVRVR